MAWVRIDDQAPHHRKLRKAGAAACWFWVCAIAHSQRQLTDGVIDRADLDLLGVPNPKPLIAKLVDVGLLDVHPDGWQVHDYLHYNDARDVALAKQAQRLAARSEAGRRSAALRLNKTVEQNGSTDTVQPPQPNTVGLGLGLGEDQKENEDHSAGCRAFVAAWNENAVPPISKVVSLTPKRRTHIAARLRERPMEEWREVFRRVVASSFCRGQGPRGWVASFDWLVGSPDSAVRVLEGKYDDRDAQPAAPRISPERAEFLRKYGDLEVNLG